MANLNFSLILVVVVFFTGAVAIFNWLVLAPKRRKSLNKVTAKSPNIDLNEIKALKDTSGFVETCTAIFPVLLIVLIIRSFLIEPFQIPSGSMLPSLRVGDFILVNKFDYGLRLPVIGTKIMSLNEPKRGDVIVFKFPKNPKLDYIKRVIGLPGDLIQYENKKLYVNGRHISEKFVATMQDSYDSKKGLAPQFNLYNQTLGQHHFQIRIYPHNLSAESTSWLVPSGMYFVMGDNRDKSYDSRYWGFVPEENIVGKAIYVWMNWPHWYQLPSFKYNGNIP